MSKSFDKAQGRPDYKTRELAKIHIAKKELDMDDDTYRAMLMQVAGVSSSKDLSPIGRAKVLEHLKASGFKGKKTRSTGSGQAYPKRPNTTDNRAQLQKIEALLADMGLPWDYLIARQSGKENKQKSMVERLTGKKRLEWCTKTDLNKVIAALAIHQKKLEEQSHG